MIAKSEEIPKFLQDKIPLWQASLGSLSSRPTLVYGDETIPPSDPKSGELAVVPRAAELENSSTRDVVRFPVSTPPPATSQSPPSRSPVTQDNAHLLSPHGKRKRDSSPPSSEDNGSRSPSHKRNRPTEEDSVYEDSGHGTKAKSRACLNVVYDATSQKLLEGIVEQIGHAANMIRREKRNAKMSSSIKVEKGEGSRRESEGSFSWSDAGQQTPELCRTNLETAVDPLTLAPKARSGSKTPSMAESGHRDECCDVAAERLKILTTMNDLLLQVEDVCENAAHQLLRDGDCKIEVESASESLSKLNEIVKEELVLLHTDSPIPEDTEDTIEQQNVHSQPEAVSIQAIIETKPAIVETKPADELRQAVCVVAELPSDIDDEDDEDELLLPPVRLTSRLTSH